MLRSFVLGSTLALILLAALYAASRSHLQAAPTPAAQIEQPESIVTFARSIQGFGTVIFIERDGVECAIFAGNGSSIDCDWALER